MPPLSIWAWGGWLRGQAGAEAEGAGDAQPEEPHAYEYDTELESDGGEEFQTVYDHEWHQGNPAHEDGVSSGAESSDEEQSAEREKAARKLEAKAAREARKEAMSDCYILTWDLEDSNNASSNGAVIDVSFGLLDSHGHVVADEDGEPWRYHTFVKVRVQLHVAPCSACYLSLGYCVAAHTETACSHTKVPRGVLTASSLVSTICTNIILLWRCSDRTSAPAPTWCTIGGHSLPCCDSSVSDVFQRCRSCR